ncbi:MAG: hypothetical protein KF894_04920 [Labilithrix sp.]|nr:hypothetical protein [Labilithrix sp.]
MSRVHGVAIGAVLTAMTLLYACGEDSAGAPLPDTDAGDSAPSATDDGATRDDGSDVDAGPGARSSVAVGAAFACVLAKDRTVSCWGRNDTGQLGRDPTGMPLCGSFPCAAAPAPVTGLANVTRLVAGDDFACALDAARAVWCWGSNAKGQLATAGVPGSFTPLKAVVGAVDLAAAGAHACAIDAEGFVRCWGDNACGLFGETSGDVQLVARRVPGVPQLAQVSLGPDAVCGTKPDGRVLCWGTDHRGSLGHDVDPAAPLCNGAPFDPIPKHVQAQSDELPISGVAEVHVGAGVACARRTDGAVLCWGDNERGALGQGIAEPTPHPRALEVPAMRAATLDLHGRTPCVVAADRLLCWGDGAHGQLDTLGSDAGGGGAGYRALAHPIAGMAAVRQVWTGRASIGAIKDDASLWMWGRNDSSELALSPSDPANQDCASGSVCVPRPRAITNAPPLD